MEQRISLVTLGVRDPGVAKEFYAALGWQPAIEAEETVFFQAGGLAVVLWGRDKLAADCGVTDQGGWGGMALAHNVRERGDVDALIATARAAGATITREPAVTFYGGYAGVFLDPDGHAWEVAHNPGFPLLQDGSLQLPGRSQ